MNDLTTILAGLNDPSAKHREHSIKTLTRAQVLDPQVISALQTLVSTDSVEYVRDAARDMLISAGQVPAASSAPVQLKEEGNTKPALFGIGVVVAIFACIVLAVVAIIFIAVLASRGS